MKEIISSPFTYAIIVTIAAFIAAYGSYRVNKTRKTIETNSKELIQKADSSMTELERASKQINESLEKAKEANIKLDINNSQLASNYKKIVEGLEESIKAKDATISAQEEILGQITGGNSYPKITLKKDGFFLSPIGSFSIPNLQVKIGFIQNCMNIPEQTTLNYLRGQNPDKIFTFIISEKYSKLWKNPSFEIIKIKNMKNYLMTNNGIIHGFDISFQSEYKKWFQKIRLISHNGSWEIADVLYEIPTTQKSNVFSSEKKIYEHVSKDFPTLEETDPIKLVPFFNKSPHNKAPLIIPIEYNYDNGISNHSFDYFIN